VIVDCISDLHGYYPELDGGDLLIVAGDLTARDTFLEHSEFKYWLYQQQYRKKIVVAGNHDGDLVNVPPNPLYFSTFNIETGLQSSYADYLCDSGTEFEGLKIYGSPWTPTFCDWYFMKDRGADIKEKWDLIPADVDILVTHGPPHGILDECYDYDSGKIKHAGCEELYLKFYQERIRPKLHVFGHIHEGYGHIKHMMDMPTTQFVNASHVDKNYKPVNKPIRVIM
jgi:Icc-related predicted phosphoesterase